jgi:hypothetical protein
MLWDTILLAGKFQSEMQHKSLGMQAGLETNCMVCRNRELYLGGSKSLQIFATVGNSAEGSRLPTKWSEREPSILLFLHDLALLSLG